MKQQKDYRFDEWLAEKHPLHESLTDTVRVIMTRLLADAGIPYLTISGRTKSINDCLSKVKRKRYRSPIDQITDISGIRIVLYFDYHVSNVCRIIEESFEVDIDNSSNRQDILSVNEVGYRSVHYVCDLGSDRDILREYAALKGLKFEFQVRTVLQHAWAELAHDRNYKFTGQLPKPIERKLFLLAALMETADNGFSELSIEVDEYIQAVAARENIEEIDDELNAINLEQFVKRWAEKFNYEIVPIANRDSYDELLRELRQFGVTKLTELSKIIHPDFDEKFGQYGTTVLGLVRDWMMTSDPDRFISDVEVDWVLEPSDIKRMERLIPREKLNKLVNTIGVGDDDESVRVSFRDLDTEDT